MRCDVHAPHQQEDCPTVESDELARLVPHGQRFGYDLIVYVGLARHLVGRRRGEIQDGLLRRGIKLSTGSISKLCDRFLVYLTRLHLLRAPQLRAAISQAYSLHLDATCEKGKGGHFICMDGIRGWVLLAKRIDTEKGNRLAPLVQRTLELFGDPVATVRDQSKGMATAVAALRKRGIPDLICHQHFLRAVGRKLFDVPYSRLRDLLKTSAVQSDLVALRRQLRPYLGEVGLEGPFGPGQVRDGLHALVHYLIEGPGGRNPAFPFALPHLKFVLRCRAATDMSEKCLPHPWNEPERRAMRILDRLLRKLEKDPRMSPTVLELQDGWRVFREFRAVLRLDDHEVLVGRKRPQQLPLAAAEMLQREDIRAAVHQ